MRGTTSDQDEDLDWDELLLYVRDGRVVPVVGDELYQVVVDGQPRTLESVLAADLAKELGVAAAGDPPGLRLAEVAFRHVQNRGSPKRLYSKLKGVLDRREVITPGPLRQLAEIRDLRLFLTTSFSTSLRVALDQARHGGRAETQVLAFSPYAASGDLPSASPTMGACVFHVLGMASSMPDYVVTDEDLIEFLHALQSDLRRPQNLFDHLRGKHLLFLGCGYTNWLARFFIRTLRNERFASGNPQRSEIVVDDAAGSDPDLVVFLRQYDAQVFRTLTAVDFVAELHRRWSERDAASGARVVEGAAGGAGHARAMPADAVFLSYAREDLDHVRNVAAALEAAGVDVWFDERRLAPGVDWDAMIQENIRRCSLFVPFVSRNTEAATEGYFRAEWQQALRRSLRMAPTRPFIVPVSVDGTPAEAPNVPPELRQWQWMRLADPGGLDALAELIRKHVRTLRAPQYA